MSTNEYGLAAAAGVHSTRTLPQGRPPSGALRAAHSATSASGLFSRRSPRIASARYVENRRRLASWAKARPAGLRGGRASAA